MADERPFENDALPSDPPPRFFARWAFVPADEPGLDALPYHCDELLLPASGEPTRAEFVLRRGRRGLELYVRGVVLHDLRTPLVLAGWHRAVRWRGPR